MQHRESKVSGHFLPRFILGSVSLITFQFTLKPVYNHFQPSTDFLSLLFSGIGYLSDNQALIAFSFIANLDIFI